jgi:hypothetical protein
LHPKHSRKFPKGLRGGDDDDPLKKEGALSTRTLKITLSINPGLTPRVSATLKQRLWYREYRCWTLIP